VAALFVAAVALAASVGTETAGVDLPASVAATTTVAPTTTTQPPTTTQAARRSPRGQRAGPAGAAPAGLRGQAAAPRARHRATGRRKPTYLCIEDGTSGSVRGDARRERAASARASCASTSASGQARA
jgi:hypothetical protein